MSGRKFILLLIALVLCADCVAQTSEKEKVEAVLHTRGEAKIIVKAKESDLQRLSDAVSLDYPCGKGWLAYVNQRQFERFLALGLPFSAVEETEPKAVSMATSVGQMQSWDRYPTYGVYVQMMQSFQEQYPDLCRLDTVGLSGNGRLILSLRISVDEQEQTNKPKFFYSSSIHGDELTGMLMLLRLCDSLLSNCQTETAIRSLLSEVALYVCPLANPDGTYHTGDNTVAGATRYNANYVDLNRNFPDPVHGEHSDGEAYQVETLAFMDYATRQQFDLAANLHGGAEVCNYPWDCWNSSSRTHADKAWFENICTRFVSKAREHSPQSYFTDVDPSGVTDGGDWYTVFGGRQDYHNFFLGCREITIEVSSTKTPTASHLPLYWTYLGEALADYVFASTRGVNGTVKDSLSLAELDSVRVEVEGVDFGGSEVYTKQGGYFFRAIREGSYTLNFSHEGYEDKTLMVNVPADSLIRLDVRLKRLDECPIERIECPKEFSVCPIPCSETAIVKVGSECEYELVGISGSVVAKGRFVQGENRLQTSQLPSGSYVLRIYSAQSRQPIGTKTIIIRNRVE